MVALKARSSCRRPPSGLGSRTQATTMSLCTSSAVQRSTRMSIGLSSSLGDWLAAWRSLPVKTLSLVLVATVRGT
jgi:hypothetical protein